MVTVPGDVEKGLVTTVPTPPSDRVLSQTESRPEGDVGETPFPSTGVEGEERFLLLVTTPSSCYAVGTLL